MLVGSTCEQTLTKTLEPRPLFHGRCVTQIGGNRERQSAILTKPAHGCLPSSICDHLQATIFKTINPHLGRVWKGTERGIALSSTAAWPVRTRGARPPTKITGNSRFLASLQRSAHKEHVLDQHGSIVFAVAVISIGDVQGETWLAIPGKA